MTTITTAQATYIADLAYVLDTPVSHPVTVEMKRTEGKGLYIDMIRSTRRGAEYTPSPLMADVLASGLDLSDDLLPSEAAAEFGVAYAAAWVERRTQRLAEARELYARLDTLTKAEASHLIDLLK